jgi:nitrate/nitrite-specific signal transduction histidine kinase
MGLHIMKYRSGMIGGALEIRRGDPRGTVVTCTFPVKERE